MTFDPNQPPAGDQPQQPWSSPPPPAYGAMPGGYGPPPTPPPLGYSPPPTQPPSRNNKVALWAAAVVVVVVGGAIGLIFALRGGGSSSNGASGSAGSSDCAAIVSRLAQAVTSAVSSGGASGGASDQQLTYLGAGTVPAGLPKPDASLSAACKIDEGGQGDGVVAKYQGADEKAYGTVLTSAQWTSGGGQPFGGLTLTVYTSGQSQYEIVTYSTGGDLYVIIDLANGPTSAPS